MYVFFLKKIKVNRYLFYSQENKTRVMSCLDVDDKDALVSVVRHQYCFKGMGSARIELISTVSTKHSKKSKAERERSTVRNGSMSMYPLRY